MTPELIRTYVDNLRADHASNDRMYMRGLISLGVYKMVRRRLLGLPAKSARPT